MDDHERFTLQLRDYFAAKAMAAHMSEHWMTKMAPLATDFKHAQALIARSSYHMADAMLAEREK